MEEVTEPGSEIVFAFARAVAMFVAIVASILLAVLLLFAKTLVMIAALHIGLLPITILVISIIAGISWKMRIPIRLMTKTLVRTCS